LTHTSSINFTFQIKQQVLIEFIYTLQPPPAQNMIRGLELLFALGGK
jgi:hypothetical protein